MVLTHSPLAGQLSLRGLERPLVWSPAIGAQIEP